MCVPLIPLALAAAGTAATFFGQRQAQKASERTFNSERDRQKAFTDKQQSRFQDSVDQTQAMLDPAAQQAAIDRREAPLAGVVVPQGEQGTYLPGSSSAPSVVGDAYAKAGAGSAATSSSLAHALAALGGTGDQLQQLGIGIGRNGQTIDQINGFKSGSMGVLDSELQAAQQKGSFLRGVGGLAQQLGMAWMGAPGGSASSGSKISKLGSAFKAGPKSLAGAI